MNTRILQLSRAVEQAVAALDKALQALATRKDDPSYQTTLKLREQGWKAEHVKTRSYIELWCITKDHGNFLVNLDRHGHHSFSGHLIEVRVGGQSTRFPIQLHPDFVKEWEEWPDERIRPKPHMDVIWHLVDITEETAVKKTS